MSKNKNIFPPRIARGMQQGNHLLSVHQILAKFLFMTYLIFYQDVAMPFGYFFILLSYLDTRWGYAFWIFAGLCLFGMLVFLLFATTQVQAILSIIVVMFARDYIFLISFLSNNIWWYWQEQPFNSNDYTGGKALEAAKLESNFSEKQEVDQTKEPWSFILHLYSVTASGCDQ